MCFLEYFRVLFLLYVLESSIRSDLPVCTGCKRIFGTKKCKNRFSEFSVPANKVELDAICNFMVACARRLSRRHDLPRRAECHRRLQLTSGLLRQLRSPNHTVARQTRAVQNSRATMARSRSWYWHWMSATSLLLTVNDFKVSADAEKRHNIKEKHQKNLQMVWCHHQNSWTSTVPPRSLQLLDCSDRLLFEQLGLMLIFQNTWQICVQRRTCARAHTPSKEES